MGARGVASSLATWKPNGKITDVLMMDIISSTFKSPLHYYGVNYAP